MTFTNRLNNLISGVKEVKKDTSSGLQEVGRTIGKNLAEGQKDLKVGKVERNTYINPVKGAGAAFKKGYSQ